MNSRERHIKITADLGSEEEKCVICHEVPYEPCLCASCEQPFCKMCILNWLCRSTQCPACRKEMDGSKLSVSKFAQRAVNKLQCKCNNEGCSTAGDYSIVMEHNCEYEPTQCTAGCNATFLWKDSTIHYESCLYISTLCDCGSTVKKKDLEGHYKTCSSHMNCLHGCGQIIKRREEFTHSTYSCPNTKTHCTHGPSFQCPWVGLRSDLPTHIESCLFEKMKGFLAGMQLQVSTLKEKVECQSRTITKLNRNVEALHRRIDLLEDEKADLLDRIDCLEQNSEDESVDDNHAHTWSLDVRDYNRFRNRRFIESETFTFDDRQWSMRFYPKSNCVGLALEDSDDGWLDMNVTIVLISGNTDQNDMVTFNYNFGPNTRAVARPLRSGRKISEDPMSAANNFENGTYIQFDLFLSDNDE
ncbi:hypothetical protein AKO1_012258 [Acrasis kona]|uniref:RING-type domain-containing protein n=1 Tax=Acrasis kona TaxID=1008807 RepID=A0AAW2ZAU6_9EUKA